MEDIYEEIKKLCKDKTKIDQCIYLRSIFIQESKNPIEKRLEILNELIDIDINEVNNVINGILDQVSVSEESSENLSFLIKICALEKIDCHIKCLIAVSLFNNYYIDVCYKCFEEFFKLEKCPLRYKLEACKYLLYSNYPEYTDTCYKFLTDFIKNGVGKDKFVYSELVSLDKEDGCETFFNESLLYIDPDRERIVELYKLYLFNEQYKDEWRILAGQYILKYIKNSDSEFNALYKKVSHTLYNIYNIHKKDENMQAKVLDVFIRLGEDADKENAMNLLEILGKEGGGSSIYDNSQNVHKFQASIDSFIEELVEKVDKDQLLSFREIQKKVSDDVAKSSFPKSISYKAIKSLGVISLDSAEFTKYNLTSSTILRYVYAYILKHDKMEELKNRLVDELIEMDDTCSTGHANRLVNVLNGFGFELKIDWKDQIKGNVNGRLVAAIKSQPNELKEDLTYALSLTQEDITEEADVCMTYNNFIKTQVDTLYKELYTEFVSEGKYLDSKVFKEYFDKSCEEWTDKFKFN